MYHKVNCSAYSPGGRCKNSSHQCLADVINMYSGCIFSVFSPFLTFWHWLLLDYCINSTKTKKMFKTKIYMLNWQVSDRTTYHVNINPNLKFKFRMSVKMSYDTYWMVYPRNDRLELIAIATNSDKTFIGFCRS